MRITCLSVMSRNLGTGEESPPIRLGIVERAGGFEPPTFCLGSKHSTTELRPHREAA